MVYYNIEAKAYLAEDPNGARLLVLKLYLVNTYLVPLFTVLELVSCILDPGWCPSYISPQCSLESLIALGN